MNHYEILEVSQNASPEVIKAAYKSLIQRYHPDRNPGNAEIAKRASLVIQAYEVLSDTGKRAAYDSGLKRQTVDNVVIIRGKRSAVPASPALAGKAEWIMWLIIALLLGFGWLIFSPSKKDQPAEPSSKGILSSLESSLLTPEQRQAYIKQLDGIVKGHPEIPNSAGRDSAKDVDARTIPILITNLTVNLRIPDKASATSEQSPGDAAQASDDTDNPSRSTGKKSDVPERSSVESGHVLSIPSLDAIVGTFDPDKVLQYIDSHRELITRKLAKKLASADYDELVKIDGEDYLKEMILDSIGETTGTDRHEDYPSFDAKEPAHYGVVKVTLPESFSVR